VIKSYKPILLFIILFGSLFWSCEDDIFPELEQVEVQIVIDAWINNKPETQQIRITETLSYYDAVNPSGIDNAIVYIIDNENDTRYDFEEKLNGIYEWIPSIDVSRFGAIGNSYTLFVDTGDEIFTATSMLNRVPQIDSISFRYEPATFFPEGYYAQAYANDFIGKGDTYWIKAYKNRLYLNKPSEINIVYDAGFTAGGNVDGITFIQPIRDAINPFDENADGELLSPYDPGDTAYVEIYSITKKAFTFLNEMKIQTDRPGGFAELFSVPLSNVPSNITSNNNKVTPIGFFNVSAVSTKEEWLDPGNLPE